jgi:hypothetical protein
MAFDLSIDPSLNNYHILLQESGVLYGIYVHLWITFSSALTLLDSEVK